MLLSSRKSKDVIYLAFHASKEYVLLGTTKGLQILQLLKSRPPIMLLKREYDDSSKDLLSLIGGISCFDVCNNLFALVAGGKPAKFNPCKVLIYDDAQSKIIIDLEYSQPVKSVFLRHNLILVLLTTKIIVYSLMLPNCKKLFEFEMFWNEYSAFAISTFASIFAFPSLRRGQLHIVNSTNSNSTPFTTICSGHSHPISSIAMSMNGTRVASCSTKGTLVRVWDCKTATLTNELRRGSEDAEIYSMAFDSNQSHLCVASDKGTIHIFNLISSSTKKVSFLPKYFSSDWSFAHCSMPYLKRCLVNFRPKEDDFYGMVDVVCEDGSLFTIRFDPVKGGEGQVINHHKIGL